MRCVCVCVLCVCVLCFFVRVCMCMCVCSVHATGRTPKRSAPPATHARTCMISAESSPTMCAPTTFWLPASTTSFMKLRRGLPLMVLRMGRKLLV